MKIALLREREDFDCIFIASLKAFCAEYFGREVQVGEPTSGALTLRQNAHLNLIYPRTLSTTALEHFVAEFRFAPNKIRAALQAAYCWLAIREPFERLLSRPLLSLQDPPARMQEWLILPGNHSNRIIDFRTNRSFVFAKQGFDPKFLRADAKTRADHPYLPVPRVYEIAESGLWFSEECVTGLPLNRTSDAQRVGRVLDEACQALARLRDETANKVSAEDYFGRLQKSVGELMARVWSGEDLLLKRGSAFLELARETFLSENDQLQTCQTHGDFQPANILFSSSEFWLIDWEYSDIRSSTYDYLTYNCRSRFSDGLSARIVEVAQAIDRTGGIHGWGLSQRGQAKSIMPIFLLEDFETRLREVEAPAITSKAGSILPWLDEAEQGLQTIKALG